MEAEAIGPPEPECTGRPGRCPVHGRHREGPKPTMDNLELLTATDLAFSVPAEKGTDEDLIGEIHHG